VTRATYATTTPKITDRDEMAHRTPRGHIAWPDKSHRGDSTPYSRTPAMTSSLMRSSS
jgi:hypothetical protein